LALNLTSTMPEALNLVWRMLVPYLDVELDLHNARGPDSGVKDVLCGRDVGVLSQSLHAVQKVSEQRNFSGVCRNGTSINEEKNLDG
jgi:hypothetical protein